MNDELHTLQEKTSLAVHTWMLRTICGCREYHRRITTCEHLPRWLVHLEDCRTTTCQKGTRYLLRWLYASLCLLSSSAVLFVSCRPQYLFLYAYQRAILSGVGEKCVCAVTYCSRTWFSLWKDTFKKVPMRMSLILSYSKKDMGSGGSAATLGYSVWYIIAALLSSECTIPFPV